MSAFAHRICFAFIAQEQRSRALIKIKQAAKHKMVGLPLLDADALDRKPHWMGLAVRDASGQAVAYIRFEEDREGRAAAKLLTRDEARRIAANVAKLPRGRPDVAS